MFQQQFRADETLFSDSSKNELLVIYLATIPAEGILFCRQRKALNCCLRLKMDTLSIKKYHRQGSLVVKKINSVKRIANSYKLPKGNTTLTNKGLIKSEREFLEFFINDVPLTELLNKFYNQKGSILDNWVGVLGWTTNLQAEVVKLKQLLGKNISDKDIRQVYPAAWTDKEFENYLDRYREELSNPEILIYCCAECGDYYCGGISILIDKTDNSIIWTITENEKRLSFEFDKYIYFETLQRRLKHLESRIGRA